MTGPLGAPGPLPATCAAVAAGWPAVAKNKHNRLSARLINCGINIVGETKLWLAGQRQPSNIQRAMARSKRGYADALRGTV